MNGLKKRHAFKLGLTLLLVSGLFSCGRDIPEKSKANESIIPNDVTFTIINTNNIPGIKRSLDVRLNKRVSEEVLRAIAMKIKSQDSRTYERTFIAYFLPEMIVDSGAWATTHFNPELEVRILGVSAEEEEKLSSQPKQDNRQIIGSWIDDRIGMGERITIFKKESQLFYEQAFKDGSNLVREVIEKKSSLGRRFEKKEGSQAGDYWIINNEGDLQFGDNEGLYAKAKKVR